MARLRLTIGNISVTTEMETGSTTIPVGIAELASYNISLVDFSFKKKMYQPTEVLANLQFTMAKGPESEWKAVNRKTAEKMFKHKRVSLEVLDYKDDVDANKVVDVIGNDYYVHEVRPCYHATTMFVKLKIYSLDKLLTLSHYCKSWTAKKLSDHILKSELPNYALPYGGEGRIECDATTMKHLRKDGQEHIFPYLVQYNESFYDLLIRTCNRWGEFVYWEDGRLHIGYDADPEKVRTAGGYHSITFHDYSPEPPIPENGTYVAEAPYDNNVLNSMVMKDGAARVFATIKNMADMDAGADYYWLRKVGQVLTNNKSIMNFMFDTAVNDLLVWAQQESLVSQWNDKHNDAYFKKKKKPYISTLDEQYTKDKKMLNQWSEADPIVGAQQYAEILAGEMTAEQNTIDIDYDTTWPGLKLGDIVRVNDEEYIVVEISSRINEDYEYKFNARTETVNKVPTKALVFGVTAIAKDGDTFYPTMIPSGHIRTSGPQVAVVVDADDPQKKNRVRLQYPWQLTSVNSVYEAIMPSDLKGHDVSDATPWLIYAASSGPAGAGVHGKHYLAEKVLVNYANNNVERPFVVGAVSTGTPGSLKTASAVMQAPNGEYIKVHEGTGKGATAFIANFTPGLSLVNGFIDFPDLFGSDNEMSKAFEGGVELGDRYGIWNISCSTDKRSIKINSPWGDVAINAFTGITINAPNGDVRIRGKNVSIEAGNNLSLVSGTNIRNKFVTSYGDGAAFNAVSFAYDVETMAAKKLASLVESVFDLSLIRSLIEVYWRPQEGALSVQSNRYLKLSAGGSKPGYPDAAYRDPKKKARKDIEDSGMLENDNKVVGMRILIRKVRTIVDKMVDRYQEQYRACIRKKEQLEHEIKALYFYTGASDVSEVCSGYDALKSKFWDPKTTKITEADLGFTEICKSDGPDDVDDKTLYRVRTTDAVNATKYIQKSTVALKEYVVKQRKAHKEVIVKQANTLLKSIAKLRTEPQKLGDLTAYGISPYTSYVSVSYIDDFKKAFSVEKCKGSTFFNYAYDDQNGVADPRANLTETALNETDFHKNALMRRIGLNLAEGWGMTSQPINQAIVNGIIDDIDVAVKPAKPETDADLEDDNKFELYVDSLEFSRPVKKSEGLLDAVASAFDPSNLKLATPISEYYSWGNAKAGQILFGAGATYSMKPDGTISKLDTTYNSTKLSKELLNEKELSQFNFLNWQMRFELSSLTYPSYLDRLGAGIDSLEDEDANGNGNGNEDDQQIENLVNGN